MKNLSEPKTIVFTPIKWIVGIVLLFLIAGNVLQCSKSSGLKARYNDINEELSQKDKVIEENAKRREIDSLDIVSREKENRELDSLYRERDKLVFYYKDRAYINAKKYENAQKSNYYNSDVYKRDSILSGLANERN